MPCSQASKKTTIEATTAPPKAAKGTKYVSSGEISMSAMAASPAPAVTPIIPGSAKGLRKIPCNIHPAKARFVPVRAAQMTRGIRM